MEVNDLMTAPLQFSLFYFGESLQTNSDKTYSLLSAGAKKAEEAGLDAIWTPERHFHPFGGLYPNPFITSAYLAAITEKIRIRIGSIVIPLHHPIKIAENLSMIDNLSNGRLDISLATGWNANDFVISPHNYLHRRKRVHRYVKLVERLWQGESVLLKNGLGTAKATKIYPKPQQAKLATWLTCTQDIKGFIDAGRHGYNVLTALLFQRIDQLPEKIAAYRQTLAQYHPTKKGTVTLMLHTLLGNDEEFVKYTAKKHLTRYLQSAVQLWSGTSKKLSDVPDALQQKVLDFAFERYYQTASLIGDKTKCLTICDQLQAIEVDELACLIDFGAQDNLVIDSIGHLAELRQHFHT
jgi:natural product biosynthesis luciferase-like monooxygenase protein